MHLLLLAIVLQAPPIKLSKAPNTFPVQSSQVPEIKVPEIGRSRNYTTPDLDRDAEITHAQMAEDIGTEKEAISNLKVQVQTLQSLRSDPDRKDIDSLKDTKTYITIFASILGTFLVGVFGFKRIIWSDIIKPRLRKEILGVTEGTSQT